MFSHYFSIAIRQLVKNRLYSAISMFGLAIGLASVFLIYQYLRQETNYDRFHASAENIYRIAWYDETPQTRTPHPMPLAMVRDFPEVENGVTLTPIFGPGLTRQTFSISNPARNVRFDETSVLAVDTTFFQVFTFPLIKGDPKTVLKNPGGILLSESMAKKYFGDEEAVGKSLVVNDNKENVEVLGVFRDVPANSHFHFDILVTYLRMKAGSRNDDYYTWQDFGHYNYVKLKPGADATKLEGKLLDWVTKYRDFSRDDIDGLRKRGYGFRLQPITDIHLKSHLRWELEANGNISYVYMMSAAALVILIIASLNFVNLTTAQSTDRAREIGIRKSLGAFRRQLSGQFIGESLLIACCAMVTAILLIELALPFYNNFSATRITFQYADFFLVVGGAAAIAGILAGIYPALYLSAIQPGLILKGKFIQTPGGATFRKSFMVFQFFASMVLISSSFIIMSQLDFMRNKSLGFNEQELLVLPVKNRQAILPRFEEVQTELLKIPGIKSVSATSNIPGRLFDQNAIYAATDDQNRVNASEIYADPDFLKTMDISLVDGRFFNKDNPADKQAFVINETAAKNLFSGSAVGKELVWDDDEGIVKGTVIGVVRDFHYQSLHEPLRPLLFIPRPVYNYVVMKTNTASFDQTIKAVEKVWKEFDHSFEFEFSFLSDQLNQQYDKEQSMSSVMIFFSALAIVITCIGLLGIAALTFRQRTKEVSIRKVLGATVGSLAMLLLRNFTQLVVISIVLAVPFSWWLMSDWLNNFTFRTTVNPVVFLISGGLMLIVTWATLSYLTLNVARVNPVETLKAE